jgi:hypothetical protein
MSESLLFAGSKSCNIPRAPVLGHSGLAPARIVNSPRLYACSKPLLRESVVTSPTICEIDEPCWYIPLTVQYIDTISVTLLGVCCSFDLYMPRPRPISVGPIIRTQVPKFATLRTNPKSTHYQPASKFEAILHRKKHPYPLEGCAKRSVVTITVLPGTARVPRPRRRNIANSPKATSHAKRMPFARHLGRPRSVRTTAGRNMKGKAVPEIRGGGTELHHGRIFGSESCCGALSPVARFSVHVRVCTEFGG